MSQQKGLKKGFFGGASLPVSKSYLRPYGRNNLLRVSFWLSLVVAALLLINIWIFQGSFLSSGPLSSDHASFENDCGVCHTSFAAVSDARCAVCHEKFGGQIEAHSFDMHYIYRSTDFTRAYQRDGETPCIGCHTEHQGRNAAISSIPDTRCVGCHPYDSFESHHPEFSFAAKALDDDSALRFAHIRHVKRIQEKKRVDDLERACLFCHNPRDDGAGFAPIRFDAHCTDCHLGTSARQSSADLTVRNNADAIAGSAVLDIGVESLEMIRRRGGPRDQWALFANPTEYHDRGGRVTKIRLYHKDPWILHNLRTLRRILYPEAGLADLLDVSADVPPQDIGRLYEEAIETLKRQSTALRGTEDRDTQTELEQVEQLLESLQGMVEQGSVTLDDTAFLLGDTLNPQLTQENIKEIDEFAQALTEPCRLCHQIRNATIVRIADSQQVLQRAEFNHAAHVIQRRCLDCHSRIPFQDFPGEPPQADASVDQAVIQNLPSIAVCRECHNAKRVSERCTTCHVFHPLAENQARLLPYVARAGSGVGK